MGAKEMNILCVKRSKVLGLLVVASAVLLISVLCTSAWAVQGEDRFALGNEAYAEGKYDEALSFYKGAIKQKGYSAVCVLRVGRMTLVTSRIDKPGGRLLDVIEKDAEGWQSKLLEYTRALASVRARMRTRPAPSLIFAARKAAIQLSAERRT